VGEVDALLDVALEALDSLLQKRLLLVGDALQGVGGLLGTVGLKLLLAARSGSGRRGSKVLTPSSMGTEKKSQPVLLALDGTEDLLGKSKRRMSWLSEAIGHSRSDCGELTGSQHRPWRGWPNQHRPWP